ncbi:Fic family protein [Compostimonas suwonensis]|uniref:Fic/DOC family protein n=1 Tax=Compostimonas suwonensis TaxID=1048394 RepID=A0A2M9C0K7_9MICO|nr:Fic family protein [Compostimonas suwonensis]PJJ63876.1 Fic/DOC family protein [Compostimonas suwonensis]
MRPSRRLTTRSASRFSTTSPRSGSCSPTSSRTRSSAICKKLYGDLWTWAGRYRTRDLNLGVDPARIAVELRGSLDNIRYRWEHTDDWTPRELGIAVHAETVRFHGFVDGNGRSTRLLADLVLLAAQDAEAIAETYDWRIDKKAYIALLREYDLTRDPKPLAAFVPVRRLDDVENG